jgi:hypothetical protein
MKEKMMKLGVLATALVLAFVFAACAQPTEEVGVGSPVIVRLYLDRAESKTLKAGDEFILRGGEEFGTTGATEAERLAAVDRNRSAITTLLQKGRPDQQFFQSGQIKLGDTGATPTAGAVPIAVQDGRFYVDIELVNYTPAAEQYGAYLDESANLYLEFSVSTGSGGMTVGTYYYIPGEGSGYNEWDSAAGAFRTSNNQIDRKEIGPGVNELYLSKFAKDNEFK